MCIFSFHGCKIEHTAGVKIQDVFQNGYLMVMPAKTLATTKVKIAKIYAFVRRNLMIYIGNKMQLNFVTNSAVFVI